MTRRIVGGLLYWLGDLVSRPMCRYDWVFLHPIYTRLMRASQQIDPGSWEPLP